MFYFLKTFPKCFTFALGLTVSITSISSAQPIASEAIEDVLVIVDPAWVIETDGSGRQWLQVRFDLENRSDRPITAWQIRWLYGSPSGDRDEVMVSTHDHHVTPVPDFFDWAKAAAEPIPRRNDGFSGPLHPGQIIRFESGKPKVSIAAGETPIIDAKVTMVVFADGEAWGDPEEIDQLFRHRRVRAEETADTISLLEAILEDSPRPTVDDVESLRRSLAERVSSLRAAEGKGWDLPRSYSIRGIDIDLEELERRVREFPDLGRELVEEEIRLEKHALQENRRHLRRAAS